MKRLRLREVELRNFRCFHRAKVDFEEDTTVVYGGASAGKTALVDALTIGVAALGDGHPKLERWRDVPEQTSEKDSSVIMRATVHDSEAMSHKAIEWHVSIDEEGWESSVGVDEAKEALGETMPFIVYLEPRTVARGHSGAMGDL